MANPMMAALMSKRLGPAKQAFGMMQNPGLMLNQMFAGNPNYQQAQQLIQQSGGDARKAFYDLAQQMGVDPEQILNSIR